jgi:fructose-1,6-bisphosphatase/inositol monophosphatase family enzyme
LEGLPTSRRINLLRERLKLTGQKKPAITGSADMHGSAEWQTHPCGATLAMLAAGRCGALSSRSLPPWDSEAESQALRAIGIRYSQTDQAPYADAFPSFISPTAEQISPGLRYPH